MVYPEVSASSLRQAQLQTLWPFGMVDEAQSLSLFPPNSSPPPLFLSVSSNNKQIEKKRKKTAKYDKIYKNLQETCTSISPEGKFTQLADTNKKQGYNLRPQYTAK